KNCKLGFRPERQIPIIVASNGQLIIRVAGEVADGVMSSSVLVEPRVSEVLELVDQGLMKSGRKRADFKVWSRLNIAIYEDAKRAYQAAKPMIYNLICGKYPDTGMFDRLGLALSDDLRHTVETVGNTHDPEKLTWIIDQMSDEYVQKTCLAGTPGLIIDQLRNLNQAGFDGAILYPIPVEDQTYLDVLQAVSSEIAPAVL
ncbi:MAG: LLM class flavin-dependent oxidoreductase, partial [Anaerolineales bacterium]